MIDYLNRVNSFMSWFEKNHESLEKRIVKNDFKEVNEKLRKQLSAVLPGVAFRVSYRKDKGTFLLEFNTQLIPSCRLICDVLCGALPASLSDTWQFCSSHPAMRGTFTMREREFTADDILMYPSYDNAKRKISAKIVKTDKFKDLSYEEAFTVMYFMLSDYLGEAAAASYMGSMGFAGKLDSFRNRKTGPVTLRQFAGTFKAEMEARNWPDPDQVLVSAESYSAKTKSYELRSDITEGTTICPDLLREEGLPDKPHHDLVRNCGIGLFSAAVEISPDSSRDEANSVRIRLEKALRGVLDEKKTGAVINSALGKAHVYTDYMVFSQEANETAREVIRQFGQTDVMNLLKDYGTDQ